jgi:hypothetical protein
MPPHAGLYPVRDYQLGHPFTTAGRSGRHGPGRVGCADVEAAEYLARSYRIVDRHDDDAHAEWATQDADASTLPLNRRP